MLFDDIVVDEVETHVPAEMDAEQAGQVLGQESASAAQTGDGDQRIVTVGSFCRPGVGIERIYRVEPVGDGETCFHQPCEIESDRVDWLASSSSRITERSSAISTSKSRLKR